MTYPQEPNPNGKKLGDRHRFEFDQGKPERIHKAMPTRRAATLPNGAAREESDFGNINLDIAANAFVVTTKLPPSFDSVIYRKLEWVGSGLPSSGDGIQEAADKRKRTLNSLDHAGKITPLHMLPASEFEEESTKNERKNSLPGAPQFHPPKPQEYSREFLRSHSSLIKEGVKGFSVFAKSFPSWPSPSKFSARAPPTA
ncbi:hypothetical protein ARMSODRAFT_1010088 [Armillaria solidipes]|uniref:Uncharacterized protein n=1 Tax=Armillaria solidipes TaxID=1076256 RepID=A0A2H3ALD3_9AGAR|nr:hypothetical protein ARMSODRAFT_1010088 [Armillaria solidipes]